MDIFSRLYNRDGYPLDNEGNRLIVGRTYLVKPLPLPEINKRADVGQFVKVKKIKYWPDIKKHLAKVEYINPEIRIEPIPITDLALLQLVDDQSENARNYRYRSHIDTHGRPLEIGKTYRVHEMPNNRYTGMTDEQWEERMVERVGVYETVRITNIQLFPRSDLIEGWMEYVNGSRPPHWTTSDMQLTPVDAGGKRSKRRKKRRTSKKN